jgi:hypothetical protein
VNPDLAELVKTSPMPNTEEGTNNIEVFIAGYLMSPRYRFLFIYFYFYQWKGQRRAPIT